MDDPAIGYFLWLLGMVEMTLVIFVDVEDELIIHSLRIMDKQSKKNADNLYQEQSKARGHNLERILIRKGFASVMEIKDEIPIPTDLLMAR